MRKEYTEIESGNNTSKSDFHVCICWFLSFDLHWFVLMFWHWFGRVEVNTTWCTTGLGSQLNEKTTLFLAAHITCFAIFLIQQSWEAFTINTAIMILSLTEPISFGLKQRDFYPFKLIFHFQSYFRSSFFFWWLFVSYRRWFGQVDANRIGSHQVGT